MKKATEHVSHPKYRPDIDGLRAVAVLAVVVFHGFPDWFKGGFIGVDIFFVISGFLISTIIFENLDRKTFSFKDFYIRRVRRIFPSFIVVMASCLTIGYFVLLAPELNQLGKHVAAGAGFISNIVLWKEVGYFDNSAETKPLLHLWSLGVEEQFYIIWPLFVFLVWKSRISLLMATGVFAIVSFGLNIATVGGHPAPNFYLPITRFWELLCGSTLAWFSVFKAGSAKKVEPSNETRCSNPLQASKTKDGVLPQGNLLSTLGALLLVFGFLQINKSHQFPGFWALVPVFGTVLIIAGGANSWVNRIILSNPIAVWFGLISFPLYLWHWPLLSFERIIFDETPPKGFRMAAVLAAIPLSWLTMRFIERPLRFGNVKVIQKTTLLIALAFVLGITGLIVSRMDFTKSHTIKSLAKIRKGFEHGIGFSLDWYQGKGDWLFLGNRIDNSVAKVKLAYLPKEEEIKNFETLLSNAAATCSQYKSKCILIMAPNKTSVYGEFLPPDLMPSPKKYCSFFLERFQRIPGLVVYDPTSDLIKAKETDGLLYYMTDSHWNNRGAFVAYSNALKLLGIPTPNVEFKRGQPRAGDLIKLSKLKNFPLHAEDSWDVVWKGGSSWQEIENRNEQELPFGRTAVSTNKNPVSEEYVWVFGDSFLFTMRQYFNGTFKEVRYVGHWADRLKDLSSEFAKSEKTPALVVVMVTERFF